MSTTAPAPGFTTTETTHGEDCHRCQIAAQQGASMARVTGSREATSSVSARTDGGDGPMVQHTATVTRAEH